MERIPTIVFVLSLCLFCSFTQVYAGQVSDAVNIDAIKYLIASLGGESGIRAIGLSGTAIQLLIRFLQSGLADGFFHKQKPWVRLSIISALTFAITPIGLMSATGIPLAAALMHATTLNAAMVFLDQIIKHLPGKKDAKASDSK